MYLKKTILQVTFIGTLVALGLGGVVHFNKNIAEKAPVQKTRTTLNKDLKQMSLSLEKLQRALEGTYR